MPAARHAAGPAGTGRAAHRDDLDDLSIPHGSATLLPQHAALLKASAISAEVAAARGYRSVTTRAELARCGFAPAQRIVPTLLIPVYDVYGRLALYQHRPDQPRIRDGRALKYETPAGARMVLDVPPHARDRLGDPTVPLVITEGARKADAAVTAGLCCVALAGVWSWRATTERGGKVALPDFEAVALNGRETLVAFDSDAATKHAVHAACERLAAMLAQRGARVRYLLLPCGPAGAKQGLDDYLAAGQSVDELLRLAADRLPPPSDRPAGGHPYRATPSGLVWDQPARDGTVARRLTNFRATIVADTLVDDGAEPHRTLELETSLAGRTHRITIGAAQFGAMAWPTEQLGAGAIVYPGAGIRDHARVAIQLLSGEIATRTVYAHTGWRAIDGEPLYLHGAGAIGATGMREDITVALPTGLDGYALPAPPAGEELVAAVRASLARLAVAPARVSYPLAAATARAVCGPLDGSLHLAGPTGAGKSELAALEQQHYGAAMDARHLPGSWESTANALEVLAWAAKDALYVVDDFAPAARGRDAERLHRDADRLLRAAGNGAGRARMRADTSLRAGRPPRGLILTTGEDVPRGQSLRARLLVLEVGPGEVDWARLTACQRDAAAGRYAAATAGYIRWLAASYPETAGTPALLRERVARLREAATAGTAHRRTPALVAELAAGWALYLAYAEAVGAIDAAEAETHRRACWEALGAAAREQVAHQATGEPAGRFVALLASALAGGRAHLAGPDGGEPNEPAAAGWELVTAGGGEYPRREWRARGQRVGWLAGDDLYLEPTSALAVARRLAAEAGDELAISETTLGRRLHERGWLATTDQAQGELRVRRVLGGARRRVWHLDVARLALSPGAAPGQSGHGAPLADNWPDAWPDPSRPWPDADQQSGHGNPRPDAENHPNGRIGRIARTRETGGVATAAHAPGAGRIGPVEGWDPATDPATPHCPGCGQALWPGVPGGTRCGACATRDAERAR